MRGCLNCRQRHLKCDKTGSTCLRCQATGRECVPAPLRGEGVSFRHGQNPSLRTRGPKRYGETDLSFPDDQVWVDVPDNFVFEDETDRTAAEYQVVSGTPIMGRKGSESQSSVGLLTPSTVRRMPRLPQGLRPSSSSSAYILRPADLAERQKLGDFNEAFLLRHFRRSLGPWLDVYTTDTFFTVDVVEMAPCHPLLLYACLAISARHLSHTTNAIPPNTADGYHERCISILLPVLENKDSFPFDILLAATIILRFFEQISSPTPSSDLQRHLLAGSVYISSTSDCAVREGLAQAAFWVFVIQDIQSALIRRSPLRLTFRLFHDQLLDLWRRLSPSPSSLARILSQKSIWILAETINLCYGDEQINGTSSTTTTTTTTNPAELKDRIRSLELDLPPAFRALHFSPADLAAGRPFPVVWFTSCSHALAIQHIYLSKTLLLIHDLSSIPLDFEPRIKEEVSDTLSVLLGIALSTDDPAVRTMGAHALCACSEWVREPMARNCLLEFLRRTEKDTGWPWGFLGARVGGV